MSYKKIEAFKHANGKLFESEEDAIEADIAILINTDAIHAKTIRESASELLPLIQRAIELNSAARATRPATTKASEVASGEPKKLTGAELNEQGHHQSCRARLTGFKADCNCNGPGKGLSHGRDPATGLAPGETTGAP